MNERASLSETKLSATARHKALMSEKAGNEGVGRALLTLYPAAREHILPDDMKKLLGEIGWNEPDNAANSL